MKRVVPFLKVDQGLAAEKDGVQLMKPMPALAVLLDLRRNHDMVASFSRALAEGLSAR